MGPQGHRRGHLGVQGWIFIDFWWISGASWEYIFMSLVFFSGLWLLFCNVGFEMSFFVGLGEEMTPGSVVGCAETY